MLYLIMCAFPSLNEIMGVIHQLQLLFDYSLTRKAFLPRIMLAQTVQRWTDGQTGSEAIIASHEGLALNRSDFIQINPTSSPNLRAGARLEPRGGVLMRPKME